MVKRLVAFGDSFSDNGLSFGCGYNRLSNGLVWVEYLAKMLELPLEDRAWCGAKSGLGNVSGPEDWSGLRWQVKNYAPESGIESTLHTLLIGINDVCYGDVSPESVVENILNALQELEEKGARYVMLVTVPDITHAPAYKTDYANIAESVRELTYAVNTKIRALAQDATAFEKLTLYLFDAQHVFDEMIATQAFRVMDRQWSGTYSYPDPDGYMWWDRWHPMTATHKIVAEAAYTALPQWIKKNEN